MGTGNLEKWETLKRVISKERNSKMENLSNSAPVKRVYCNTDNAITVSYTQLYIEHKYCHQNETWTAEMEEIAIIGLDKSVKVLRVIIQHNLKWNQHVEAPFKKRQTDRIF